eukprot:2088806-Amphidinium_carterae.1
MGLLGQGPYLFVHCNEPLSAQISLRRVNASSEDKTCSEPSLYIVSSGCQMFAGAPQSTVVLRIR